MDIIAYFGRIFKYKNYNISSKFNFTEFSKIIQKKMIKYY